MNDTTLSPIPVGVVASEHKNPFESAIQQNPRRAPISRLVGPIAVGSNPGLGTIVLNQEEFGMYARSLVFINTSGSTIQIDSMKGWPVPPSWNYVVRATPSVGWLQLSVAVSAAGAGVILCIITEEELPPTALFPATLSAGAAVGINAPIGQTTMANSVGVVIASNQSAIPVSGSFTPSGTATGAVNHTGSVITLAAGAGSLLARPTRTGVTFFARSANAADVVIDGYHLHPGATLNASAVGAYAMTGTTGDILDVMDEYN